MQKITIAFLLILLLSPMAGCTGDDEEAVLMFPSFSAVADDGQTYDNERMAGSGFIVVFSAECETAPAIPRCTPFGTPKLNSQSS